MKKVIFPAMMALLLLSAPVISLTSCGSDDDKSNTPAFTYSLNKSGDITFSQGGGANTTLSVSVASGTAQKVSLSASAPDAGIHVWLNPASGTPPYSVAANISADAGVPAGTYTVTITAKSAGMAEKQMTLDVTVTEVTSCIKDYLGTFNAYDDCGGTTVYYNINTQIDPSGADRLTFTNIGNYGGGTSAYADFNCSGNTLNIPRQDISIPGQTDMTIKGSGTYSSTGIHLTYTFSFDDVPVDACEATLSR